MQRSSASFINDPDVVGGVLSRAQEVEVLVKKKKWVEPYPPTISICFYHSISLISDEYLCTGAELMKSAPYPHCRTHGNQSR